MIIESIIIVIYTIALLLIFAYSLSQLNLLFNYLRAQRKKDDSPKFDFTDPTQIPYITIQLPVYNEMYVMERLLDNIALLEYPQDKLEIQVLDDSTDESFATTAAHIERLGKNGLDIKHVTRSDRSGFKAGALSWFCGLCLDLTLAKLSDCRGCPKSKTATRKMRCRYSCLCGCAIDAVDAVRSAIPEGL